MKTKDENQNILRRKKTIEKLKEMQIDYAEDLPMLEINNFKLKSLNQICRKMVATIFAISYAVIRRQNINDFSDEINQKLMDKYGVSEEDFNELELKAVNNTANDKELEMVLWEYEIYWTLLWAIGLVDDISDSAMCNCEYCVKTLISSVNYFDFVRKCKLRDINEIIDALDLYYHYAFSTYIKKYKKNNINVQNLNYDVCLERRRALLWLLSPEFDWFNISTKL